MAKRYTKEDVRTHSDGYRPALPAVNVKLHNMFNFPASVDWSDVEVPTDEREAFRTWLKGRYSDDDGMELWSLVETVAEFEMDYFADWAVELFGPSAQAYRQGRSGGWLVVDGLEPIESWDAVALARWRKWERVVRGCVAVFPTIVANSIALNEWEFVASERAETAADDAAAMLPILAGI